METHANPAVDLQVHFKLSNAGSPYEAQQCLVMLQSKAVDLGAYFAPKIKNGEYTATITSQEVAKSLGTLVRFPANMLSDFS